MPFAAMSMANTALSQSSLLVTEDAICYLNIVHALHCILTVKTMLHLVSDVQCIRCLLLQY